MAKYSYVVLSNPVPGREDEYNAWYDNQHIPDVLKVPGIVSAQRLKLAQEKSRLPGKYLAIYELDSDDPSRTIAELNARAGTPQMPMSDALDMSTLTRSLFAPLGPALKPAG